MNEITQSLRRVRRRMDAQSFLEKLTVSTFAGCMAFSAALGGEILRGGQMPGGAVVVGIASLTLIASLIWTAVRRATLHDAAVRIDALARTRDRFVSTLAFSENPRANPLELCAIEECGRFVAGFDSRPFTRLRAPRRAAWLLAPALACAALAFAAHFIHEKNQSDPAAQKFLAEKADALEQLAKQIDKANAPEKNGDLQKLAEELRKSEARLRDDAKPNEDANKSALRELSSLEEKLSRMRSPQDLAALALALQGASATKSAGDALKRGDLVSAAEQLEKLADKLAEQSAEERERLERALQQALAQLGESPQNAMSADDTRRALQHLADALKQRAGESQRGGSGAQGSALQATLAALQEMKDGMPRSGEPGAPGDAQGRADGQRAVQNFHQNGDSQKLAAVTNSEVPSGQPGSEHDTGTTKTPFGTPLKKGGDEAKAASLSGALGQGESLQSLVTTHGDSAKPAQRVPRDL